MAALPTASTPGYTTFRGMVACVCLAKWLGVYERLLLAKGLIKVSIDPWQLTGGAAASGGTHSQGGAFDLLYQTTAAHVAVAREMGAPATWSRTVSQGFSKAHTHGVLSGCPHNAPAAYQITAQRRGYNGLGVATSGQYAGQYGYGSPDNHPDPQTYRTWEQGIAWAESEIARLNPAPPPPPAPAPEPAPPATGELTVSDVEALNAKLAKLLAVAEGLRSEEAARYVAASDRYNWTAGALRGVASKVGAPVDVDEEAIVAGLSTAVADAVNAAVSAGVPTNELADAVVARLGAKLAPADPPA